jgi:hypothetical protein
MRSLLKLFLTLLESELEFQVTLLGKSVRMALSSSCKLQRKLLQRRIHQRTQLAKRAKNEREVV